MGQYYKPCSIEKMEHVYSHDYNNGLKLMEHSYIGNNFVAAVESLLCKGGRWYGNRIVWAGDYADNESNSECNLYQLTAKNRIKPLVIKRKKKLNFLKNLDTGEWVDLRKVPITYEGVYEDDKGKTRHYTMRIHPLPLLTCEGNGRGGGDYHKEHELVGKWARNRVSMQSHRPRSGKEIIFDLVE